MNLSNFKNHIDSTILKRGFDYFYDGHVATVSKVNGNEFKCCVLGSKDYVVTVEVGDNGEIIDSLCNCPYDFGPVCKHEVAAYYAVSEIMNARELPSPKITFESDPEMEAKINEALGSMSSEQMFHFIYRIATSNYEIAEQLVSKYVTEIKYDNSIIMDPTIRQPQDDFRNVSELEIAMIHLDEAICEGSDRLYDYDDESYWYLEECVDEVDRLVSSISDEKLSEQEAIFIKLLDLARYDEMIQEKTLECKVLKICMKFADNSKLRSRLLKAIDEMAERCSIYSVYSLNEVSIEIFESKGTSEELEDYISKNMNYPYVVEYKVKDYISKGEFNEALELIHVADKTIKHFQKATRWNKLRYHVYQSASMTKEQSTLAKEMFCSGHTEFYCELKELNKGNFESFYTILRDELKEEFYKERFYSTISPFVYLIEKEKDYEELLELVQNYPTLVERYQDILQDKYKEEVADVYVEYIYEKSRDANSRKKYAEVCRTLRRFKKLAGKARQDEVAHKLRCIYKNRPAFLDELSKL